MSHECNQAAQLSSALAASIRRQTELGARTLQRADKAIAEAFRTARNTSIEAQLQPSNLNGIRPSADESEQCARSRSAETTSVPDGPPPWSTRSLGQPPRRVVEARGRPGSNSAGHSAGAETLTEILEDLGPCSRCRLCEGRQTIVFGIGNPSASLMFVGEGPGAEEDAAGEPFVGRAGQLLDKMIVAMGLTREGVYIANIVKCRPPGNRDPEPDEVATCLPFLERQLRAVRPRVIVTLGRVATQSLLGTDERMGALRGKWFQHHGTPVMPTWHPAYLLRNAREKRSAWTDLQEVMKKLAEAG